LEVIAAHLGSSSTGIVAPFLVWQWIVSQANASVRWPRGRPPPTGRVYSFRETGPGLAMGRSAPDRTIPAIEGLGKPVATPQ
jgi:hypothetical protein